MAFHIRDPATDLAVRKLAKAKGKSLTETVREAVEREYKAMTAVPPLIERLGPIQAEFRMMKRDGGEPADKAFFDALSGHI
jgi:antitoxin VapB